MWYLIFAIIGYIARPMIESKVNMGIANVKSVIKALVK